MRQSLESIAQRAETGHRHSLASAEQRPGLLPRDAQVAPQELQEHLPVTRSPHDVDVEEAVDRRCVGGEREPAAVGLDVGHDDQRGVHGDHAAVHHDA